MKPNNIDTADASDMSFEVSELHESEKGLKIEVTGKAKPKCSATATTTAPVFYDSSNDENLFFTLPDLNFDSNSEEDGKSGEKNDRRDAFGAMATSASAAESPIKSDIDFSPTVDGSSSSDIKNFSVMKRYLKKEKKSNIIIELNEVDAAGVVVKTQIVQADEFSVSTNTKADV